MAFGVLSGKYLDGARPANARLTLFDRFVRYSNPQANSAATEYVALARRHGLNPGQMALAWVLKDARVTSALIGASNLRQIEQCVAALANPTFVADELAEIDRWTASFHAGTPAG